MAETLQFLGETFDPLFVILSRQNAHMTGIRTHEGMVGNYLRADTINRPSSHNIHDRDGECECKHQGWESEVEEKAVSGQALSTFFATSQLICVGGRIFRGVEFKQKVMSHDLIIDPPRKNEHPRIVTQNSAEHAPRPEFATGPKFESKGREVFNINYWHKSKNQNDARNSDNVATVFQGTVGKTQGKIHPLIEQH